MRRGRSALAIAIALVAVYAARGAEPLAETSTRLGSGAEQSLRNGSFDGRGDVSSGWQMHGASLASLRGAKSPVRSSPRSAHVRLIGKGSSGADSFMLYQLLDPAPYRGRTVRFGAQVKTDGAGVNVVLYTPEGQANQFVANTKTKGFVQAGGTLDVPANASMLSFGIQVLGPASGQAWIDDAFVEPDAARPGGGTKPPRTDPAGPTPGPGSEPSEDPVQQGTARVELDARSTQRVLSPLLFGMHVEWVENGLGLLDPQRPELRAAVVDLLRPLRPGILRFPGGIHADRYDWRLGDGPPSRRGSSPNVFNGKSEKHRFGTPELISLARTLGADALITANVGTGTPAQAGAWAQRFAELGFKPRFWEVGNEIYLSGPTESGPNGRDIFHSPEEYARDFPAFRDSIQAALPEARIGAIAHLDTGAFPLAPASNRDWTTKMLAALETRADFFAVHNAYAPVILDDSVDFRSSAGRTRAYRSLLASAAQVRENVDRVAATIAALSPANKGAPIAITELGPFFGISNDPTMHAAYVDQTRTLAAALYVASVLDTVLGDPRVFMTCYTNPIHPWLGSLLTDTPTGLVRTPTYHLYELYRSRFEPNLIATSAVVSPTFAADALGIVRAASAAPDLLARASLSPDRKRLTAMLVNRSLDTSLTTTINPRGFAAATVDCQLLTAPSPAAINGSAIGDTVEAGGEEIRPHSHPCRASGAIELTIPPSSIVSVVASR